MENKKCSECKEIKSFSEFWKDKSGWLGRQTYCKVCSKGRVKKWNADRGEQTRARDRAYYRRDIATSMLEKARARAKKNSIPFSLIKTDIIVPSHCPILGLALRIGSGSAHDASPSLDRIIPEKGYVPGNIIVISHRANTIKSNATVNELFRVYQWLNEQIN
jgi:hypothetical protein